MGLIGEMSDQREIWHLKVFYTGSVYIVCLFSLQNLFPPILHTVCGLLQ